MIYQKNGSSYPEQRRYYQCFEYMFIFSKGNPKTVNLIRDRKNKWNGSWGKRSRRNIEGYLSVGDKVPWQEYGIRFNVWKINTGFGYSTKDNITHKHPAIFPDKLAEDHIRSWSNEGDTVLDPFVGSGTSSVESELLKRNSIGIDLAQEYCQLTYDRLLKAVNQTQLGYSRSKIEKVGF